jgi:hypothetical protein
LYPEWIRKISPASFLEYVEATATAETFVTTHKGSYNHSIIDMVARGTRVVCGPNHTPRYNIDRFGLVEAASPEAVPDLLARPVDHAAEAAKRSLCTDLESIPKLILEVFA